MKKRYWISALILFLAGLFVYFFVYAYQFTGIVLCALAVVRLIFGLLDWIGRKIFGLIFKIALIVGLIAILITGIFIGAHMGGAEDPQADYAIVLGAGVNGTEPSVSLLERLDAAERYLQKYPQAILILSGGQGENEEISEAQCMYEQLLARGISSERLRIEDCATSTEENIRFSIDLIERETGRTVEKIGIISSEYHLLRAEMIAEKVGVEAVCYPADTDRFFYLCNMFVREIFAVWKTLLQ